MIDKDWHRGTNVLIQEVGSLKLSLMGYSLTLFYPRSASPPYGFFVLNRNGVENFSANLAMSDDLELTTEFIIYRASEGESHAREVYCSAALKNLSLSRRGCHWDLDL